MGLLTGFIDTLDDTLLAPGSLALYPRVDDRGAWHPLHGLSLLGEAATAYRRFDWPAVRAEHYLTYQRHGRQTDFLTVRGERRTALAALVLGECAKADGQGLDDIANGLWAICEESYWGNPGALYIQRAGRGFPDPSESIVELGTGETAALLAWTLYLLDPVLDDVSPMLRQRVELELRRRVLDVCLARDDLWWMGFTGVPVNNWTPWVCSNWLTTVLLIERDAELLRHAVAKMLRSLDIFLDSYADDGGCDEGPGYWNRAGGSLLECLELLHAASDGAIDVYDDPKVQQIGRFPMRAHIADRWFVNFADAPATVEPCGPLIYTYGQRIGDSDLSAFGAWAANNAVNPAGSGAGLARQLHTLFVADEMRSVAADPPLPECSWFPGIQVLTARQRGGSAAGAFVAVKGGTNAESHNHNDVGNVIVYVDGCPVLVDAGVETYSARTFSPERYDIWTMQSGYHNLPQIGGYDQLPSRRYHPGGIKYTEEDLRGATDVVCEAFENGVLWRGDIAAAYPEEAGVVSWVRQVQLDRAKGFIEITDTATLSAPTDVRFHFMTPCDVELAEGTVYLRRRSLPAERVTGAAELHFEPSLTVEDEQVCIDDSRVGESWGDHLHRLCLVAEPVQAATWRCTVRPAGA